MQRIIDRCLEERVDESGDSDFRSEPLQVLLHGVPGAGKSEVLFWIRDFFETVCKWTHGKEFVFLASQNSMAALIDGFTFRSFCRVPFMKSDGTIANTKSQQSEEHGMSNLFLRYERLRFIFIDEFLTTGCEVLAIGDANLRHNIRETHTVA